MNDLLDETDKDTEFMKVWVALRNKRGDDGDDEISTGEDSVDLVDDDNSVDYLTDAVSKFFGEFLFCGCLPQPKDASSNI